MLMPVEFHVPLGQWPVHTIFRASRTPGKRQFLVDWRVNTLTGDIYKPSWVRRGDVIS